MPPFKSRPRIPTAEEEALQAPLIGIGHPGRSLAKGLVQSAAKKSPLIRSPRLRDRLEKRMPGAWTKKELDMFEKEYEAILKGGLDKFEKTIRQHKTEQRIELAEGLIKQFVLGKPLGNPFPPKQSEK